MKNEEQPPTSLNSQEFWTRGLRDMMSKAQRPGHLMHLAHQFLDKLPGALGEAVADVARAELGDSGRPHRAASKTTLD